MLTSQSWHKTQRIIHQSCVHQKIFYGRTPYNAIDIQYLHPNKQVDTKYTEVNQILDKMNAAFRQNSADIIKVFHICETYYDGKARTQPLKINDFVFLLNPKFNSLSCKEDFEYFHWRGPYKIMKVLSDSNYVIRRVSTHQTRCVHRMRIRRFKPSYQINDPEVMNNWLYPDNEGDEDSNIFDNNIPQQARELDENETTHTRETNYFPHLGRQIRRYDLKRNRPLKRSPQRLSQTPGSEVSINSEPWPSLHVRIDLRREIIRTPPSDENRIDLRPTDNSSQTHHSEPDPPIDSPPITSRNNTSRYGLRPNPTRKRYPYCRLYRPNRGPKTAKKWKHG